MNKIGAVNIEAYRNRDGRFVARVTFTDPTWTGEPYVPPPQLVGTTEPGRARLADALKDAEELVIQLSMRAVIKASERGNNV